MSSSSTPIATRTSSRRVKPNPQYSPLPGVARTVEGRLRASSLSSPSPNRDSQKMGKSEGGSLLEERVKKLEATVTKLEEENRGLKKRLEEEEEARRKVEEKLRVVVEVDEKERGEIKTELEREKEERKRWEEERIKEMEENRKKEKEVKEGLEKEIKEVAERMAAATTTTTTTTPSVGGGVHAPGELQSSLA